jgi:hypothetical protein
VACRAEAVTSLPDAALEVVRAYLDVNPRLDTRLKIRLGEQAATLLKGGMELDDLRGAAREFALIDGHIPDFSLWCWRRRHSPRAWWVRD